MPQRTMEKYFMAWKKRWVAKRLKTLINDGAELDIKLKSGKDAYSAQPKNRILIEFEHSVDPDEYKNKIQSFIKDKLGLELNDSEIGCNKDYLIIQGNSTFSKLEEAIKGLQHANLEHAATEHCKTK